MSLIRFLTSKSFVINLAVAGVLLVLLCFVALRWLDYTTNHDQHIEVPDISRMSLEEAEKTLSKLSLRVEVMDSANYNPSFAKYAVIDQVPEAGKSVKENRKIYITLNPSGYKKMTIPPLLGTTRRQAEPTLLGLGFEIGKVSFKPHLAEVVLEMRHDGKKLEPGDLLQTTSVIDLVLGDGKLRYGQSAEAVETSEISETSGTSLID